MGTSYGSVEGAAETDVPVTLPTPLPGRDILVGTCYPRVASTYRWALSSKDFTHGVGIRRSARARGEISRSFVFTRVLLSTSRVVLLDLSPGPLTRSTMPDPTDLPSIQRLGFGVTVMLGLYLAMFVSVVVWINATTGEPVVLTATRHGEAPVETVLLAILLGVSAYGMVVVDYVLRG